jgi:hypothetical protein
MMASPASVRARLQPGRFGLIEAEPELMLAGGSASTE